MASGLDGRRALRGHEAKEVYLFPVSVDGKWGYIDRGGKIVWQSE